MKREVRIREYKGLKIGNILYKKIKENDKEITFVNKGILDLLKTDYIKFSEMYEVIPVTKETLKLLGFGYEYKQKIEKLENLKKWETIFFVESEKVIRLDLMKIKGVMKNKYYNHITVLFKERIITGEVSYLNEVQNVIEKFLNIDLKKKGII